MGQVQNPVEPHKLLAKGQICVHLQKHTETFQTSMDETISKHYL